MKDCLIIIVLVFNILLITFIGNYFFEKTDTQLSPEVQEKILSSNDLIYLNSLINNENLQIKLLAIKKLQELYQQCIDKPEDMPYWCE